MSRTHRRPTVAAAAVACLLILAGGRERFVPRLLFNTTASAPIGFYWITPGRLRRDHLAAVRPPAELARWMAMRGYLPANVPLLKEVAGVPGQHICARGNGLWIDAQWVAWMRAKDRWGRALPAFHGCRRLRDGEVFLLNRRAPSSLDGRYFGPLPEAVVLGEATPLWTWGAGS